MTRRISGRVRAEISNQHRGRVVTRPWEAKANGDMQIMRRGDGLGKNPRGSNHAVGRGSDHGRIMVIDEWSRVVRVEGGTITIETPSIHAAPRNMSVRGSVPAQQMTIKELETLVSTIDLKHSAIPIEVKTYRESPSLDSTRPDRLWVHLRWRVPERTTGEMIWVNNSLTLDTSLTRSQAVAKLGEGIREVYTHEFRECFVIEGDRPYDPHPPAAFEYRAAMTMERGA